MERRSFIKGASQTSIAAAALLSPFTALSLANSKASPTAKPYHFSKSLEKTRHMPGIEMSFIVNRAQTDGNYAVIEGRARKGAGPSLHVHEFEDEAFYMLDGEMVTTIGEEEYHVKPGDYIFLPKQIPHAARILTETIHILLYIFTCRLGRFFLGIIKPCYQIWNTGTAYGNAFRRANEAIHGSTCALRYNEFEVILCPW